MSKQVKPTSAIPPKKSTNVALLATFSMLSIAVGAFLVKLVLVDNSVILHKYIPIPIEGKQHLILLSLLLFGAVMFVKSFLVTICRVVFQKIDPVNQEDPLIIRTLNRALQNSIEYAFMFYPAFTYFTLYKCTDAQWVLCQNLGLLFVVARVLFALGYLCSLVGISTVRGVGVFTSVVCVATCYGLCFGVNILKFVGA